MNEHADMPESRHQVPGAVHEATRSLLRLSTGRDARRVAEHLVRELGGVLVTARSDDPGVIPVDVSFGDGEPLLPAAPTLLAADQTIFGDFLGWLHTLLILRGVPPRALVAGLEALRPMIGAVDTGAARLLDLSRQELLDGPCADPVTGTA
jgi:hypothetical protein